MSQLFLHILGTHGYSIQSHQLIMKSFDLAGGTPSAVLSDVITLKVIGPMSQMATERTNLCCIQEMMDFPGKLVRINLQSPNKNYALYRLFIFFWGSLTPGSVTVNKVEPHRFVSLPKCIVGPWIYEPLDVQLWRGTPHKEWCRFLETEQPCLDRVDIHPGF